MIKVSKTDIENTVRIFNENKTRIRISITANCNLVCSFCHREGLNDYTDQKDMSLENFSVILNKYAEIGGSEVNITGGEPLMHPDFKSFIQTLVNQSQLHTTLSTNGLCLDDINLDPQSEPISETKISFHTFDQALAQRMLGKHYDVERVEENIARHLGKGYRTILNFTLTEQNYSDLEKLVEWVTTLGTHLKISDLGQTSRNMKFVQSNYLKTDLVDEILTRYAIDKKILNGKRSGTHMQRYILPKGNHILVKSRHNEQMKTGMCQECPSDDYCSEGVFALRVNPNGIYQPCLVNMSFNTDPKDYVGVSAQNIMEIAIFKMITGYDGIVEIKK